jgi:hypothetical protein
MTQPLNYTPKAVEDLSALAAQAEPTAPLTSLGIRYLVAKLRAAEVFVLSDSGQLLDRGKPRPELPGLVVRPPFPVVALEYEAATADWQDPIYNASQCSRRIALAWDYTDDLPGPIAEMLGRPLPRGVVIASISFYDEHQQWMPIAVAMHVDYEADWHRPTDQSAFRDSMLASGRLTPAVASARTLPGTPIPVSPETIFAAAGAFGLAQAWDMMSADLMDEAAAYMDLCWALACKNVSTRRHPAPEKLNRQRAKAGKLPLYGFHVLELSGEQMSGAGGAADDRRGPRSHLRRGHIRRLSNERVTWVNQTMVRGRGFVDKVYAA